MGAINEEGLVAFRQRMRRRLAQHGERIGVGAAEVFAAMLDL